MLKCPYCQRKLEELTEITGYHYWMCGNDDCEMSYKFYRKEKQKIKDSSNQTPLV